MGWQRFLLSRLLVWVCLFLGAGAPAAAGAEPAPPAYRALSRGEAAGIIFREAKDWVRGLEEVRAVQDALRDTWAGSPRFKAAAGAVGAAFGYFEGGRGSARLGLWDLSLDTSGRALRSTVSDGNGRLLKVGLRQRGMGWQAEAAVGLREGRLLNESLAIGYKLRY